jgi:hypothetical protein
MKFGEIELTLFNLFIFRSEITEVFFQIINSNESVIYIFQNILVMRTIFCHHNKIHDCPNKLQYLGISIYKN